ncbi:hypothetical protein AQULUS_01560 [Aquicella lusitana]|uniref:Uncharacterized protein n=1 Tax=Aquicella lusitana TaxID=254246 RepID=A0A370GQ50_9COXI|nr:hypothetical protein C8D86_10996 [Aquicella lusitana]VVC72444.1 hypothetical protein AQULUS_01560 [Aquicella lusitana]
MIYHYHGEFKLILRYAQDDSLSEWLTATIKLRSEINP